MNLLKDNNFWRAFAVVVGRLRSVKLSGEFSTLGWKTHVNFLEDPNQMKSSFIAIALTALFVTAGIAQTEQESVSDAPATTDAVVTEVTPSTDVTPIETVPMTESPVITSPMIYSSPMEYSSPMSSCGCSGVPMTMTSYVAPVTYQEPIVQQAQQISQPIAQSTFCLLYTSPSPRDRG